MTLKEYMRNPNPSLDALADTAEREREADNDTLFMKHEQWVDVQVKDVSGKVVWGYTYTSKDEFLADIPVLLKPSMFGVDKFMLCVHCF